MGGCTITMVADTINQLFLKIEEQVLTAARSGLYPDSELIVINPDEPMARIFKATVIYDDTPFDSAPKKVEFEEVDEGRAFHIGVSVIFGPKPEKGQLVGMIHVHS